MLKQYPIQAVIAEPGRISNQSSRIEATQDFLHGRDFLGLISVPDAKAIGPMYELAQEIDRSNGLIEVAFRGDPAATLMLLEKLRGFKKAAGTITTLHQARYAVDKGADILIIPGFVEDVPLIWGMAQERGVVCSIGSGCEKEARAVAKLGCVYSKPFPLNPHINDATPLEERIDAHIKALAPTMPEGSEQRIRSEIEFIKPSRAVNGQFPVGTQGRVFNYLAMTDDQLTYATDLKFRAGKVVFILPNTGQDLIKELQRGAPDMIWTPTGGVFPHNYASVKAMSPRILVSGRGPMNLTEAHAWRDAAQAMKAA